MSNSGKKSGVSRREFLKQTGAAIGGITLVSLSASASCGTDVTPTLPTNPTSTDNPASTTNPDQLVPSHLLPKSPPLMQIPGCDALVALDRKYSAGHVWVFLSHDDIALVGITDSLINITGGFRYINVRETGTVLNASREDTIGFLDGYKIVTDLITPISGTVLVINRLAAAEVGDYYSYTDGWLAVIRLSNPDELNKLYTPQYYAYREAPSWSGPVPPMY